MFPEPEFSRAALPSTRATEMSPDPVLQSRSTALPMVMSPDPLTVLERPVSALIEMSAEPVLITNASPSGTASRSWGLMFPKNCCGTLIRSQSWSWRICTCSRNLSSTASIQDSTRSGSVPAATVIDPLPRLSMTMCRTPSKTDLAMLIAPIPCSSHPTLNAATGPPILTPRLSRAFTKYLTGPERTLRARDDVRSEGVSWDDHGMQRGSRNWGMRRLRPVRSWAASVGQGIHDRADQPRIGGDPVS